MLFFSYDAAEVELACAELAAAGIRSEVRTGLSRSENPEEPVCKELWIHHPKESNRALMICVQLGVGFSRRRTSDAEHELDSPEPHAELV